LNDVARDRKTQANAAAAAVARMVKTAERLECEIGFVRRDARSIVSDGNRRAVCGKPKLDARATAIFDGIVDKIGECPFDRYRLTRGEQVTLVVGTQMSNSLH
jgi:hypothetical protein